MDPPAADTKVPPVEISEKSGGAPEQQAKGESSGSTTDPASTLPVVEQGSKEGSGLEAASSISSSTSAPGQVETAPSVDKNVETAEPSPGGGSVLHEAIKATVASMPSAQEAKGQMSPEDMEFERIKTTYAVPVATTTPAPPGGNGGGGQDDYFEMIDGTKVFMDAPNTIVSSLAEPPAAAAQQPSMKTPIVTQPLPDMTTSVVMTDTLPPVAVSPSGVGSQQAQPKVQPSSVQQPVEEPSVQQAKENPVNQSEESPGNQSEESVVKEDPSEKPKHLEGSVNENKPENPSGEGAVEPAKPESENPLKNEAEDSDQVANSDEGPSTGEKLDTAKEVSQTESASPVDSTKEEVATDKIPDDVIKAKEPSDNAGQSEEDQEDFDDFGDYDEEADESSKLSDEERKQRVQDSLDQPPSPPQGEDSSENLDAFDSDPFFQTGEQIKSDEQKIDAPEIEEVKFFDPTQEKVEAKDNPTDEIQTPGPTPSNEEIKFHDPSGPVSDFVSTEEIKFYEPGQAPLVDDPLITNAPPPPPPAVQESVGKDMFEVFGMDSPVTALDSPFESLLPSSPKSGESADDGGEGPFWYHIAIHCALFIMFISTLVYIACSDL